MRLCPSTKAETSSSVSEGFRHGGLHSLIILTISGLQSLNTDKSYIIIAESKVTAINPKPAEKIFNTLLIKSLFLSSPEK
jgi:hypothetical protein